MQNIQETTNTPNFPPPILNIQPDGENSLPEMIGQLPPNSNLILHKQTWENYEKLLAAVGEAGGLRISFDSGTLQIRTLSTEHENYAQIITRIVDRLSVIQNIEILFFGSATIKKSRFAKGIEPDACFYVQSVEKIGGKIRLDFSVDPPPDIALEIDLYHDSLDKFPIYAALGINEIWRYSNGKFEIYKLTGDKYEPVEKSVSLPVLSAKKLGALLNRSREERQTKILKDFEKWLQEQL